MNDSISKGEIIHAVNAEVNKPKKVRYKLHTPIEEVVIEFDEKEEVTSIDHILSDSIPIFEESAQAYKAWTGEDMGKTEPSDLISRADAIEAVCREICDTSRDKCETMADGNCGIIQRIDALPSADIPTEDYSDLPDIPRAYYEKIVGNMAHEINMLKEQLESADAVHGYTEWLETIIVDNEGANEWLCEDTPDLEWCENNCHYSSIQAECLRHLYEISKGGDDE